MLEGHTAAVTSLKWYSTYILRFLKNLVLYLIFLSLEITQLTRYKFLQLLHLYHIIEFIIDHIYCKLIIFIKTTFIICHIYHLFYLSIFIIIHDSPRRSDLLVSSSLDGTIRIWGKNDTESRYDPWPYFHFSSIFILIYIPLPNTCIIDYHCHRIFYCDTS